MNQTPEGYKPDFRAVAVDVSEYYRDLPIEVEKILDVYVYDANTNVYVCSLTPSREMHHVYTTVQVVDDTSDERRDELEQAFGYGDTEPVIYMGTEVDRLPFVAYRTADADTSIDDVREYFQGNCPF